MNDKAADAFRTISEVADDLDLPQHVLRFWETRFPQIKPMKRGGGRRYYRPQDVALLKGIRHLLYVERYTIKGVQKLLRENGVQFAHAIGSGDLSALTELTERTKAQATVQVEADAPVEAPVRSNQDVDDIVVGSPQPKSKGLFRFGKDAAEPAAAGGSDLSKDNRALLQEALFDLLECKRLLDQVR
ncbi:MAG: MerR family transcriptional regulator [Pseudomonadota bacterium]